MSSELPRDEPQPGAAASLRSGLAHLDRRLRALQDELAAADAPAGASTATAAPIDPAPRAPTPASPTRPPDDPAAPERLAEELAVAIISRAEEQARNIVASAYERVQALNRQAEELLALQEDLRRSAGGLIEDFSAALARMDGGRGGGSPIA